MLKNTEKSNIYKLLDGFTPERLSSTIFFLDDLRDKAYASEHLALIELLLYQTRVIKIKKQDKNRVYLRGKYNKSKNE